MLFAEDTDGEVTITFDAVDLSGAVSPMFSMQYIIDGSFENTSGANDRLYIRLEVTLAPSHYNFTYGKKVKVSLRHGVKSKNC